MGKFRENNKRRIILFIAMTIIVVVVLGSITYAFFVPSIKDSIDETLSITSGNLTLRFRDNSAEITPGLNGTWNFGDSIEKEVAIENNGTQDLYAQILWENLVNIYLPESLTYTLEEKSSEAGSTYKKIGTSSKNVPQSTTASTQELADHLLVPAGKTNIYKITVTLEDLPDIDQTADLNAHFTTKFTLRQGTESLFNKMVRTAKKTNPNFAKAATTDETKDGLYSMVDDTGNQSYYYRGAVENNYVKFGKNKLGQDMYWRIIRFNGNGSIRMQYDGIGTADNSNYTYTRGSALTSQVWNTNKNDAKYVGWMFKGTQLQTNEKDSKIKVSVDKWYKENILDTGYNDYISDEIFCNDRSSEQLNHLVYGAFKRVSTLEGVSLATNRNPKPSFICLQDSDKFTVNTESGGNGVLTYSVGLITVDEMVAAGSGIVDTIFNEKYYLYNGMTYWTFSPSYFSNNNIGNNYSMRSDGIITHQKLDSSLNVLPVINIKAEYVNQLLGDGTAGNPYRLQ